MSRLLVAALAILCSCDASPTPSAYPARPIRLVVPFAPGGSTDTFARIYKKAIEDHDLLPQPIVIVNVDGAGGTIGSRRVMNAPADGYTILLLHQAMLTAKRSGKTPYGPEAFAPIAATGESHLIVATRESGDIADLRDAIDRAASSPDTVLFGANVGAPSHFVARRIEATTKRARFRFVQTGGGAKRFAALRGGHIELSIFSVDEFLRFRTAGLRAIAFLGKERHEALADVPTAIEQGVDVEASNVHFWWAPKAVSPSRVAVLAAAIRQASETEYVRQKMAELRCDELFLTGDALDERLTTLDAEMSELEEREIRELPHVPMMTLIVTLVLLVPVLLGMRRRRGAEGNGDEVRPDARFGLAAACIVATLLYVGVLATGRVSFEIATLAFVLATGSVLTRSQRTLPALVVVAIVMSFGLGQLFTRLFTIDLP
jgi:tripartite-type tricarboxylate transporter receptor subunit TctC